MKYVVLFFLVLTFFTTEVFAGEKEQLVQEYNNISQKISQGEKTISILKRRLVEIEGVLKYLQKKENEVNAKKKKALDDAKKIQEDSKKSEESFREKLKKVKVQKEQLKKEKEVKVPVEEKKEQSDIKEK